MTTILCLHRANAVILSAVPVTRVFMAAVVTAGVGLATAPSASAVEEPMYGVYTYHQEGMPEGRWEVWPTCVVAGCTLHIAAVVSPNLGPQSDNPPYNGDAMKVRGLWTFLVKDAGVTCPDGSTGSSTRTYAWDEATLAGTLTVLHGDVCGLEPEMTKVPFTLQYKEPLPIPVILDPLNQIDNLW
jgi:hypothetical protein